MSKHYPGEHPRRLQTKSNWQRLGWILKPDAAAFETLVTEWGRFDLYDYDQTIPIKGDKARERREDFMFAYLRKVTERLATEWALQHPGVTDEEIQDHANTCNLEWYMSVFFIQELSEDAFRHALYRLLVFAFEVAALKALGRTYEDYAYNDL